jgi:hypothetical protein
MSEKNHFVGLSKTLSIDEALADAVKKALAAQAGIADAMVEFELVELRGRAGGIAGLREVSIEIAVPGRTAAR